MCVRQLLDTGTVILDTYGRVTKQEQGTVYLESIMCVSCTNSYVQIQPIIANMRLKGIHGS